MADSAILDVASRVDHLEPAQMAQRLASPGDGDADRIVNARLRRADELDHLVDMLRHGILLGSAAEAPSSGITRPAGKVQWLPAVPRARSSSLAQVSPGHSCKGRAGTKR